MSTRGGKIRHGLDHNVSPREDLSKYGETAVKAGKLSRTTLNRLKRQEAAHANAVEGFPFFVAGSMSLPSLITLNATLIMCSPPGRPGRRPQRNNQHHRRLVHFVPRRIRPCLCLHRVRAIEFHPVAAVVVGKFGLHHRAGVCWEEAVTARTHEVDTITHTE